MDDDIKVLERIYDRFNARDIDGVLTVLTDDVAWANGMDGGHVHGHAAGGMMLAGRRLHGHSALPFGAVSGSGDMARLAVRAGQLLTASAWLPQDKGSSGIEHLAGSAAGAKGRAEGIRRAPCPRIRLP